MLLTDGNPPESEANRDDLAATVRDERLRYDEATGSYRLRRRSDERIGTVVALGVAALLGRLPTDIPPLAETVDVDALGRVFDYTDDVSARISFEYADCTVTVRADDVVTIRHDAD